MKHNLKELKYILDDRNEQTGHIQYTKRMAKKWLKEVTEELQQLKQKYEKWFPGPERRMAKIIIDEVLGVKKEKQK